MQVLISLETAEYQAKFFNILKYFNALKYLNFFYQIFAPTRWHTL